MTAFAPLVVHERLVKWNEQIGRAQTGMLKWLMVDDGHEFFPPRCPGGWVVAGGSFGFGAVALGCAQLAHSKEHGAALGFVAASLCVCVCRGIDEAMTSASAEEINDTTEGQPLSVSISETHDL